MKTMTPEHKAIISAARDGRVEKQQERRAKSVTIDGYKIFRFDELNIVVEKPSKEPRYYNTWELAFKYVLNEMITPLSKTNAAEFIAGIKAAGECIAQAIQEHGALDADN